MNITIVQFFHWYFPVEANLWNHAKEQAGRLAKMGITHVWLPPAYKSAKGVDEPGYAVYDLFDLGEFDQKGSVRTRYGTRQEYLDCIQAFHESKLSVLADIVLNHKIGADEQETITVHQVHDEKRNEKISDELTIEAHTKFVFPGRNGKYSDFIWDAQCFSGICENDQIYLILTEHTGGEWEDVPEKEYENYDYLMGCDIEFRNRAVREELKRWGKWYVETTGLDGFRLDAVKHIVSDFYKEWLHYLKTEFQKDFLCIGEYWRNELEALLGYIGETEGMIQLFDVPLHFNFHEASHQGSSYDMRQIFDNTLVSVKPELAVTFVDNHDTQPLQSLESWVEHWFKPHAYALILLRQQGLPCVFYTALYGANYTDAKGDESGEHEIDIEPVDVLELLIQLRSSVAYGEQYDYFDHPNIVGWTRIGADEHPGSGCAVLLSNGEGGEKILSLGEGNAGKKMLNVIGNKGEVILNENGEGKFSVDGGFIAVWKFENANE